MNLKLRDEEAFAAEYQNEPATEQFADERLTADQEAAMRAQGEGAQPKTIRRSQPKVGRNDPCPCGSGRKYKQCCGKKR